MSGEDPRQTDTASADVDLGPVVPFSVRPTLVTWLLVTLVVLIPLFMILRPYLVSVASGSILAVLVYPLYARLRRYLPRWAAGLLVSTGVVLLVLIPAIAMSIGAIRQGAAIIAQVTGDDAPTLVEFVETLRRWIPFLDTFASPAELKTSLQEGLRSVAGWGSNFALRQLQAFPVLMIHLAMVVLSTHFSLVDGRRLYAWIGSKLPLSAEIRSELADSFHTATNAVVVASLAGSASQAAIIFVGFRLLGVPSALLAAGLTFVLSWVPNLASVVWLGGAIYLYSEGSMVRTGVMIGIGVVVGLVDNVVRPLVLRGQREIHPMVSLVSILGGIAAFGPAGVFMGPLVACMAIAVLEIWPAVASYCGIAVSGSGDTVPHVPRHLGPHGGHPRRAPPPAGPPT